MKLTTQWVPRKVGNRGGAKRIKADQKGQTLGAEPKERQQSDNCKTKFKERGGEKRRKVRKRPPRRTNLEFRVVQPCREIQVGEQVPSKSKRTHGHLVRNFSEKTSKCGYVKKRWRRAKGIQFCTKLIKSTSTHIRKSGRRPGKGCMIGDRHIKRTTRKGKPKTGTFKN